MAITTSELGDNYAQSREAFYGLARQEWTREQIKAHDLLVKSLWAAGVHTVIRHGYWYTVFPIDELLAHGWYCEVR